MTFRIAWTVYQTFSDANFVAYREAALLLNLKKKLNYIC